MSDEACQHVWLAYADFTSPYRCTRWRCKLCSLDIDNFEWVKRYAALSEGPANICMQEVDNWGIGILELARKAPLIQVFNDEDMIDVEDADTEEEFLKNAEKAWLEKHGKER